MSVPYFILWKWTQPGFRTKYTAEHVNTMIDMMTRQGVPLDRIIVVTDDSSNIRARTFPLWTDLGAMKNVSGPHLPSCYRRLKIFDSETTDALGIPRGERACSVDVDAVILQDFLALFNRQEDFVGWHVPGHRHRIVLNGSMYMFTAGKADWLWHGFDPVKSPIAAAAAGYMGSDQGYLSHMILPKRAQPEGFESGGWSAHAHGVLSYTRDIKLVRRLPKSARVVFFAGKRKPWDLATTKDSGWILRYTHPPAKVAVAAPVIEERIVA